jgi:hypothetical protein
VRLGPATNRQPMHPPRGASVSAALDSPARRVRHWTKKASRRDPARRWAMPWRSRRISAGASSPGTVNRLWQLDLWRRRGLGLLAESFGPGYLAQDRAARSFVYRGDMTAEWAAYGSSCHSRSRAALKPWTKKASRRDPARRWAMPWRSRRISAGAVSAALDSPARRVRHWPPAAPRGGDDAGCHRNPDPHVAPSPTTQAKVSTSTDAAPPRSRARAAALAVGLSRPARAENLQGAFRVPEAARPRLAGRRILLVDEPSGRGRRRRGAPAGRPG